MRVAVLAVAAIVVVGCSDTRPIPLVHDTTSVVGSTSALVGTPGLPTTTLEGTPVGNDEAYRQAGLDATQVACLDKSGIDGDFSATPGATASAPTVLESDAARIEVPASVKTGADLELTMLATLAKDSASPALLERVAAIDGAADDAGTVTDDLPAWLLRRSAVGATKAEVACIDKGFRAAPVLLSSLVADPSRVETACASSAHRAEWRRRSLDAAFAAAGASAAERACLSGGGDLSRLSDITDALSTGEPVPPLDPGAPRPRCAADQRLQQLALVIVTKQIDFGDEQLSGN